MVSVSAQHAWVSTDGASHCARCAEGHGCGGALMGRLLGKRLHTVRALLADGVRVAPGDRVRVGLAERALLGSAALAYLLPLASLFVGMLAVFVATGSDRAAIAGALAGLAGGAFAAHRLAAKTGRSAVFQPVIVACDRPAPGRKPVARAAD